MFRFGEEKSDSKTIEPSRTEDNRTAVIHTMEDDLNALQGIIAPKKEITYEYAVPVEKNNPPVNKYTESARDNFGSQKSYSPFLNTSVTEEKRDLTPQKEQVQPIEEIVKSPIKWNKILFISVLFIVFLSLSAGGYYFWITRNEPVPEINPPATEEAAPENTETVSNTTPVQIEPEQPKFSAEKPNYLSIDTESASSQTLKQLLIQTASEVKEMNPAKPIEFIVTDSDNDPVAFPIFSLLSGLKLSSVSENLDEKFSLFMFPDAQAAGTGALSNVRLGLAVDLKNKPGAVSAMKSKESTLIDDLLFLFLDTSYQKTAKLFNDNSYNGHSIRYINIDEAGQGTLSIDYSFTEKQLILATSKNMMWILLDMVK
jgi:hypothetical protein